jgi:hypothetical protein
MQKWHNRVVPIGPATTIRSGQTGQGNDTGSWLDWSHVKIWAALGQTVIIIAPPRKGKSGTSVFQARQITWRIHPSPSFPFERDGAVSFPRLEQILRPYLSTASTRKGCTLETTLANNWKKRHQHQHR